MIQLWDEIILVFNKSKHFLMSFHDNRKDYTLAFFDKIHEFLINIVYIYILFSKYIPKLFMLFISCLLLLNILILYLTIFISFFPIKETFEFLLSDIDKLDFPSFIRQVANLIEFILFDIVLFMLATGIYVYIFNPLIATEKEKKFSLKQMLLNFVSNLSTPFLMVLASILIVSVFEVIITLFSTIIEDKVKDWTFFYPKLLYIFLVLLSVIAINILIRIEESICHKAQDENILSTLSFSRKKSETSIEKK